MPLLTALALSASLIGQTSAVKIFWEHNTKESSWYKAESRTPRYTGAGKVGALATKTLREAAAKDLAKFIRESKEFAADGEENPFGYDWATVPSISKPTLISTYSQVYSYAGGAHPNHWYVAHTFGTVGGKQKQLRFSDLMRTKIAPKAVVTSIVIPRLKAMGASSVVDGDIVEVPDENVDCFVITPAGITWIFSPYDVASYAEGDFFVKVPWSDLQEHLNPSGPLKGIMPAAKN